MIRDLEDQDIDPQHKRNMRLQNIPQAESPVLAAYIVAYRALGVDKEFAMLCMAELARRRSLGEDYDFEGFIEVELAKIPKIESLDIVKITKSITNNVIDIQGIVKK